MSDADDAPSPALHSRQGLRVQIVPGGSRCLFEILDRDGRALAHVALDTPELDSLVRLLGELRAALGDPVPATLDPGARVAALLNPAWQVDLPSSPHVPDGVVLALRHAGLGWLGFLLPRAEAATLGHTLARLAQLPRPGPALAPAAFIPPRA